MFVTFDPNPLDNQVMQRFLIIALSIICLGAMSAMALDPIEQKAQTIDKKLIAPCCWTATLDQHFSEVSEEMKSEIRDRLTKGESEQQILAHFEEKYGERVLSEPKAAGFNMTVWIFPFIALAFGLFMLSRVIRKTPKTIEEVTNTMTLQTTSPERDEKYKAMIDQELYRKSWQLLDISVAFSFKSALPKIHNILKLFNF